MDVRKSISDEQDQVAAPKSTIYKFEYVLKERKVVGYKPAYDNVTDIMNLNIASLRFGSDVTTPFIVFANTRHNTNNKNKVDSTIHEAKWILRFPNGSDDINKAWKRLVKLVEKDILWDIKAAPLKDDYTTQVICVYKIDDNDIYDIVMLYDILLKYGLIDLHMAQDCNNHSISYVTDSDTRNKIQDPRYNNVDIEDLHKLFELKESISKEMFERKWAEFATALECKKKGLPNPDNYVKTYFSSDETSQRVTLLKRINQYQLDNETSDVPQLDDILRVIRATLTSNYKFTTIELMQHGVNLLLANRPNQNRINAIFSKDPVINKYNHSIDLLKFIIKDEQLRLKLQVVNVAQLIQ